LSDIDSDAEDILRFFAPDSSVPDYDGQVRWTAEEIERKERILNEFASVLTIQQTRVIARFCQQYVTLILPWHPIDVPVEVYFAEWPRAQAFWTAKLEEKLRDDRAPSI